MSSERFTDWDPTTVVIVPKLRSAVSVYGKPGTAEYARNYYRAHHQGKARTKAAPAGGPEELGSEGDVSRAAQKRWYKKLAPEDKDIMKEWAHGWQDNIRDCQAKGKGCGTVDFDAEYGSRRVSLTRKQMGDRLQAAIESAPQFNGTVYRGMSLSSADLAALRPGKTMTMKAISSSSQKASVALDFAAGGGKGAVILKLHTKRGAKLPGRLSEFAGEKEVLLPKGAKYKITRVRKQTYRGEEVTVVVAQG